MTKASRRMHGLVVGAIIGIGAFALVPAADAATFEVDRVDDPAATGCTPAANDCSLRGAIANSNNPAVNDTITFAPTITGATPIVLATQLLVTDGLAINGSGAGITVISGNEGTRIFEVNLVTPAEAVTMSGVTLTEGDAVNGGAIKNEDAALTITDSVISNSVGGAFGGAIFHVGGDAALGSNNALIRSTLTNNSAQRGGAIGANSSFGTIESSTISGNEAIIFSAPGAQDEVGGGVFAYGGSIINSTIAGNYATNGGGGVYLFADGSASLSNTIVADNTSAPAPLFGTDVRGSFPSAFSLVETPGGMGANVTASVPGSLLTGVDPALAPLAANGGPTPTRRPLSCSPVIDKGGNTGPPMTDQRGGGFARVVDLPGVANSLAAGANGADMGSVELSTAEASTAATCAPPGGGTGGGGSVLTPITPAAPPAASATKCKKKKKKKGKGAAAAAKCKKKKKKKKK
jgi:hypothetical protein